MSIRLANVSKDFGNTKVLSDISVEIEPGEFFVMVGPSGSGKSTLLRMIAGLTSVSDGRIYRQKIASWRWFSKTMRCCHS